MSISRLLLNVGYWAYLAAAAILAGAMLPIVLFVLSGCGAPYERPYCRVCDEFGLCRYEPGEREADAERKAAFWGTDAPPREIPAIPPMPTILPIPAKR